MARVRRLSAADVVVSTTILVLLGTFGVAWAQVANDVQMRVKCASNLRMIGQAMMLFSNEHGGAMPRTRAEKGAANPVPVWGTPYRDNKNLGPVDAKLANPLDANAGAAPKPNDVTAALFLLIRTQDIGPANFVCPSTGQTGWNYGSTARQHNTARNWTNWPGDATQRDHLSYSMQNPYASADATRKGFKWNNALPPSFAIAADMNPGIDALLKLTVNSPRDQMIKGNSPNHGGEGQNVLFGDGHVQFDSKPFIGVDDDNIYTYGPSGTKHPNQGGDGIVGSPADANDSILLPTAKDLGIVDAAGNLTAEAKQRRDAAAAAAPATRPAVR